MKTNLILSILALGTVVFMTNTFAADPYVDSWFTANSGKYARIYTTDANKTAGAGVAIWSNGSQTQSLPAYAGVQEIYSSANWVYIRSTGLGSHIMGPWYLNAAHTMAFPNYPVNQKLLWRFPRTPTIPTTKTPTGLGTIGLFVDGVAMFDSSDGFVWTGSAESGNGTGYWHREAYANEGVTFDPGYAHQEQTGTHHYHANPIALRYLLGDHVDYNPTTKTYSEATSTPTKHSPILAWVRDGLPLYGPYGYSNATNAASGVRRMLGGFQLRNGSNGTDNLATNTTRATIPAWAQRLYSVSAAQAGPAVSTTYPLGRYMEDYAYLGDLTNAVTGTNFQPGVDFDLSEYNVRWCVTPEFPGGTYAYFVSIETNGTPKYPNNIGRAFFGNPTGSSQAAIAEMVTTNFSGGPAQREVLNPPAHSGNTVVLTWSGVEGGTYRVESSTNLTTWTTNATGIAATLNTAGNTNPSIENVKFFRVNRTALASFDPVSGTSGGGGGSFVAPGGSVSLGSGTNITVTITLPANPPNPPANAPITSVMLAGVTGTGVSYTTQGTVVASFALLAGTPTGAQNISVQFTGGPAQPYLVSFTINP